jgi:glucose/mannose-6-phosphate isomerase
VAARDKLALVVERNRPEIPAASNRAKQYAQSLLDRIAVIYGAGLLANVARRWKCQINENSKAWAFFEEFPELNHNAVLGYRFPPAAERLHVVLLDSPLVPERVRRCFQVIQQLLDQAGVPLTVVAAGGEEPDPLTQMLSAALMGDFVSYYLALLYQVDPTPVDAIDFLKAELARG